MDAAKISSSDSRWFEALICAACQSITALFQEMSDPEEAEMAIN